MPQDISDETKQKVEEFSEGLVQCKKMSGQDMMVSSGGLLEKMAQDTQIVREFREEYVKLISVVESAPLVVKATEMIVESKLKLIEVNRQESISIVENMKRELEARREVDEYNKKKRDENEEEEDYKMITVCEFLSACKDFFMEFPKMLMTRLWYLKN